MKRRRFQIPIDNKLSGISININGGRTRKNTSAFNFIKFENLPAKFWQIPMTHINMSHLTDLERTSGEPVIKGSYIFKLLLLITLLIISYLVFSRPGYNQSIAHIDKVGHFSGFFILSALSHLAFRPRWYLLFFGLIAYAGIIEIVQSYLPYRSASWADLAADILGISGFYLLLLGHRKQGSIKLSE